MPVLPAFAPQRRRSYKSWGFSLQKSFFTGIRGWQQTGRNRDGEHNLVRIIAPDDALSVHFGKVARFMFQRFLMYKWQSQKMLGALT